MANPKITAQLILDLNLCYTPEQLEMAEAAGGQKEYTVDELLLGSFLEYDDALFTVCRTEITPAKVLRDFATMIAREELNTINSAIYAPPFVDAVAFLGEGNADWRSEELAEHAEAVQKFMVGALVIKGPGDFDKPEKVAAYERLHKACKSVRAATKPNPGEAAYGAALWSYKAEPKASRDGVGWKHRRDLAEIFQAAQ